VASLVVLLVTVSFLIKYVGDGNNIGTISSVLAAVMAVTAVFYNLSQLRNARVPESTLKKAKRR
jgi:hypothetical protein